MPRTKKTTDRADLRAICWIDVHDVNSVCHSFVLDKLMQLVPSPAMQSGTHTLVAFDSLSYVLEVFKYNNFRIALNSLFNKCLANNVICFFNASTFFARDSLQTAFSRARTVGLKFSTSCKKLISFVSKFVSFVYCAVGRCSDIILAYVYGDNVSVLFGRNVWDIKDNVEKPTPSFSNQFSLFNNTILEIFTLKISELKGAFNSTVNSEEGENISFKGKSPLVVMHASVFTKVYYRNILVTFNLKNFERSTNLFNGIANHLRAEGREKLSDRIIAKMVEGNPIPTSVSDGKRNDAVTSTSENLLRLKERVRLFWRQCKLKVYSSFHIGYININKELKQTKKERGFLPRLKSWVSTSSLNEKA